MAMSAGSTRARAEPGPALTLDEAAERLLRAKLAQPGPLGDAQLADLLRLLAKWRSQKVANTIVARDGTTVRAGPFAGLVLGAQGTEGGHAPRLLGCYEQELHPILEDLIGRGFARVVNIGCSDGYYAVGLARRMPGAVVHAHDTNPAAQAACAGTAAANGVAARVRIGGEVDHAALATLAGPDTLLIVDIEGAEEALLDPAAVPSLATATILVECHEGVHRGIATRLAARFAASHAVRRVDARLCGAELPPWLGGLSHLDQLLAVWEWRQAPTPWLLLEPRGAG
jgi:hypothetical protein